MAITLRNLTSLSLAIMYILSSGCATQASLTISTQPEGAYITEAATGKSFGMAPVVVRYNPAELNLHINAEGCYLVKGFEARWVSGAVTSIAPIKLCGSGTGNYDISLERIPSYPGLEKDLQFVIQLQTLRVQQQQAQAASDAATAALWSAWSASEQNSVDCKSTPRGNSVYTNCK